MSQNYEPVVPLEGGPMPEEQQFALPSPLPPPPPPAPPPDEPKDVQDNYEAIADFNDVQYVPGDEGQQVNQARKKNKTVNEASSETTENSAKGRRRQSKKRRRAKKNKISLWIYAVTTILMLAAAMACTASFIHGLVDHWFT